MFPSPNRCYIGRSIQKRLPLTSLANKPILEKYNQIIDSYLLNSRHKVDFPGFRKLKTVTFPVLVENTLPSLTVPNFKPRAPLKKNPVLLSRNTERTCVTPSYFNVQNKIIERNYRAKSVQIRKKHKVSCTIQTDFACVISERESQDEESPVKFTPMYKKS